MRVNASSVDLEVFGSAAREDEKTAVFPAGSLTPTRSLVVPVARSAGRYHESAPAHASIRVTGLDRMNIDTVERPRKPDCAPDPSAQLRADEAFRTAELLLERGHARDAVLQAQKAMRECPPRPEQEALYAWMLFQRDGGKRPVRSCVWAHLDRALEADPECERAHAYVALLRERR
jgi:hypothetical protein